MLRPEGSFETADVRAGVRHRCALLQYRYYAYFKREFPALPAHDVAEDPGAAGGGRRAFGMRTPY